MKDKNIHINQAFLSLPVLLSILLMLINDHVLKGSGLLPGVLTGKISDFAFLFFAPLLVAFLFRVRTSIGLFKSYALVIAIFVLKNIFPGFSAFIVQVMGYIKIEWVLWNDMTDLLALTIIPCSWVFTTRKSTDISSSFIQGKAMGYAITILALVTCVSTSRVHKYFPYDLKPPVPGNNGILQIIDVKSDEITIGWSKGDDQINNSLPFKYKGTYYWSDTTSQDKLRYIVLFSLTPTISGVSDIHNIDYDESELDIDTKTISGLTPNTEYYFNVAIIDVWDNFSMYEMTSATTLL